MTNETFPSGAVRQKLDDVRYDLISPFALRRLAMTYAEGAKKYDDHNWRKGMPFSALLNHIMEHLTLYSAGENGTDHLAHAAWGLFAMMEEEETMPWMNDLFDFGDEVHLDGVPADPLHCGCPEGLCRHDIGGGGGHNDLP